MNALPDTLRLGPAHLTVSDLERSLRFYEESLGLVAQRRGDGEAALGAGADDLLVLVEEKGAQPAGRHAGLYHFALLHPGRQELAHALERLARTRAPISGASDHGVSEAIYLNDPDGNGIELYADRPREQWPAPSGPGEKVGMFTEPLDLEGLLAATNGQPLPEHSDPRLVMGHMHLHVGDIADAVAFYGDVLGLDVMTRYGPSAAFLAAGGYHHHLGVNVWRGQGVGPAPPGTVGLRHWTVVLDDADQVAAVRSRVEAAGLAAEGRADGFVVRDPWDTAVAFVSS